MTDDYFEERLRADALVQFLRYALRDAERIQRLIKAKSAGAFDKENSDE